MTKYHINPDTGKVAACRAKTRCPYGDLEVDHYDSRTDATKAYETAMAEKTFETLSIDAQSPELRKIRELADTGHVFGGSSARNTDLSEGGTQAVAVSRAVGIDVSAVDDPEALVSLLSRLPAETKNIEELFLLGARLLNSRDDSRKIEDTVVLGSATHTLLNRVGFNDEEIAKNLRWMAKENTKGNDGTVGDVGIDLDGRSAHVSLKVRSNTLHNAGPAQAMTEVGEVNYDPYEVPEVRRHDEAAFLIAGSLLKKKINEKADTVTGAKSWNVEEVDGEETVVYREPARKKLMFAPVRAFSSLREWKELTAAQQKVLSYFVTDHSKELVVDEEYSSECLQRQAAINSDVISRISSSDENLRRFTSRMLGLRNSSAFYLNKGPSAVYMGRIPTIGEFLNSSNIFVGKPIVSPHSDAVKIPLVNLKDSRATVLQVRTRLADGQFNYRNVKMTGEYQSSKNDVEFFGAMQDYKDCTFGSITDVVFSLDN